MRGGEVPKCRSHVGKGLNAGANIMEEWGHIRISCLEGMVGLISRCLAAGTFIAWSARDVGGSTVEHSRSAAAGNLESIPVKPCFVHTKRSVASFYFFQAWKRGKSAAWSRRGHPSYQLASNRGKGLVQCSGCPSDCSVLERLCS